MKLEYVRNQIEARKTRSAWAKGVNEYAFELLEKLETRIEYEHREPANPHELADWMLNGAINWNQYSEGGCSLIYDGQIAKRLCNPSELKRLTNKAGALKDQPNPRETWIECQARALRQAAWLICDTWPLYNGKEA